MSDIVRRGESQVGWFGGRAAPAELSGHEQQVLQVQLQAHLRRYDTLQQVELNADARELEAERLIEFRQKHEEWFDDPVIGDALMLLLGGHEAPEWMRL